MKRIALLLLCLCFVVPNIAKAQQHQQEAIVKTRGRLQDDGSIVEGRRIAEATVVVKEVGTVESDDKGELKFGVPSSNDFYISNISKEGYTLSDADVISKSHKYQAQPIDLLLESIDELNAYRRSIERKVRRNYQHQLDLLADRIDSLESLANVNAEEIARQRAELEKSYDVAEKYIEDMTQRYLNIDFDREDEFDREISHYILNGKLDKADSMLATRGDIIERVNQNIIAQNAVERDREQISNDCYRKYEIANQRLERDTAAFYLKLRAQLDPHNIDWQMDAAQYLYEIKADYDQALSIYEPALQYSLDYYGEYHDYSSTLYSNIGSVYSAKGDYDTALEYHQKVLKINEKILGPEHSCVAIPYDNIGFVYSAKGDYDTALEYHQKALRIKEKILDPEHPALATTYNNIGFVYSAKGDYDTALDYYKKALRIREIFLSPKHPAVALSYNNIGTVYHYKGDLDTALEYHQKALRIDEKILDPEHPALAVSYNNIGSLYHDRGDYDTALDYYQKALRIKEKIFDPEHPDLAMLYSSIGIVYYYNGDYNTALDYYQKALRISEKILGSEHPNLAILYDNIGTVYYYKGNYGTALDYLQKALAIMEKSSEIEDYDVAYLHCSIGAIYYTIGNYSATLEHLQKALPAFESEYGEDHPGVVEIRNIIEECKSKL